jgi:succinate dehydrogenase hydrophobic anchor subunit
VALSFAKPVKAGRELLRHVVPAVVKPARTLWHEVFGFLFLCLAVLIGSNGIRFYLGEYDGSAGAMLRVGMTAFCVLLFGFYGVTSFLRARRISRS